MRHLRNASSRITPGVCCAWFVAYTLVLGVPAVSAQSYTATIPEIRTDSFSITGTDIQLSLDGLRTSADSAIGVKMDSSLQTSGSIQIGDFVTVKSPDKTHHLMMMSFAAIPKEKLQIGKNSIAVPGLGDLQGSLYVLLTVPAATHVTISINGKVAFAGTPSKGVVIHGGRL